MVGRVIRVFQHEQPRHSPRQVALAGEKDGEVIQSGGSAVAFETGLLHKPQQVLLTCAQPGGVPLPPVLDETQRLLVER